MDQAPPYSTTLSPDDLSVLSLLWGSYWDGQALSDNDTRLTVIALLRSFFLSPEGRPMFEVGTRAYRVEPGAPLIITLDYPMFVARFPATDFSKMLYEQPVQTLSLIGLAASLALGLDPRQTGDSQGLQARFEHVEPVAPMGSLKSGLVGRFVTVKGTVARASAIRPLVLGADFECFKCGVHMPMKFTDGIFQWPESCPTLRCRNKNFELRRETAVTVDYQKIKLQEIDDEGGEPGRIPRTVEVELRGDLVDTCVPGDVVAVAGVVKSISAEAMANRRTGREGKHQSLYLLYVQANSVTNKRQVERQTDEDMEQMEAMMDGAARAAAAYAGEEGGGSGEGREGELAKIEGHFHLKHLGAIRAIATDPYCFHLLVASLCPPIVGQELVKAGLLLVLLGGSKRTCPLAARTRVRIRSDPHVLLVGDPGLGKSQLLRACHDAAPRAVYLCGTLATNTGLTVTLVNDGRGDVALEAGALVLADQGICCIDELDKLSCSYHALLEAMEQQQISIAKSGVVTSLSARCSVIAAANPVGGQYHRGKTVSENLKMSGALFSRFDLVFIMLDRADDEHDARVSEQVVRAHAQRRGQGRKGSHLPVHNSGTGGRKPSLEDLNDRESRSLSQRLRMGVDAVGDDPIPKELLRKYIAYAQKVGLALRAIPLFILNFCPLITNLYYPPHRLTCDIR